MPEDPSLPPKRGLRMAEAAAISVLLVGILTATVYFTAPHGPDTDNFYGFSLFVFIPMLLGGLSTLLYEQGHNTWKAVQSGWLALLFTAVILCAFAIEGVICMIMAAPILLGASALASAVVSFTKGEMREHRKENRMMASILVLGPAMVFLDARSVRPPAQGVVSSSTVIHASPAQVWQELHNFEVRAEPGFWLFRFGVAYPVASHTDGVRRVCSLSTGEMQETIDVWEPGRRLHFRVLSTPPCMKETTIYGTAQTPHLRGYFESEAGEFRIEPLPSGYVRLVGTSWYRLSLYPSAYWQLWSDSIVHQAQLHVMEDIRRRAEGGLQVPPEVRKTNP